MKSNCNEVEKLNSLGSGERHGLRGTKRSWESQKLVELETFKGPTSSLESKNQFFFTSARFFANFFFRPESSSDTSMIFFLWASLTGSACLQSFGPVRFVNEANLQVSYLVS